MTRPRWMKSIRFQLTFWYILALFVIFSLAGSLLYAGAMKIMEQQADQALSIEAAQIIHALTLGAKSEDLDGRDPNPIALISQISGPSVPASRLISDTVFARLARQDNHQTVVLSQSLAKKPNIARLIAQVPAPIPGHTDFRFVAPDEEDSVRCLSSVLPGTPYYMQIALPWDPTEDLLTNLSIYIGAAVLLFLVISAVGSSLLIGRTLRPIDAIVTRAEGMTGNHFSPVLLKEDHLSDNEVGHLVTALNAMMMRITAAFDAQRRFTADSSHELRTPLTILQGEFELALSRERTTDHYKEVLSSGLEETARMARVVDSLSVLARYDAGQPAAQAAEEVSLTAVVDETTETLKRPITEKKLRLTIDTRETAKVYGNADSLSRMVRNLVENAITYTEPGGRIEIKVEHKGEVCRLVVADSGAGISPEDLPHVFERFYRADKARSYNGGSGLGLSIVHSIVQEHGGKVCVESEPGKGARFTVTLPCPCSAPPS